MQGRSQSIIKCRSDCRTSRPIVDDMGEFSSIFTYCLNKSSFRINRSSPISSESLFSILLKNNYWLKITIVKK